MSWPLWTRVIQLSLGMSALRVDWTLSGVFTIGKDVGQFAEAVLDPTPSVVFSTPSTWVAHEATAVLGNGKNLGGHNALCGPGQGAEKTISLEDLEQ